MSAPATGELASEQAVEHTVARQLRAQAREAGFDCVGITAPDSATPAGERLREFLALGRHGDMAWLVEKADRRASPAVLWPAARSIVMLGMNYGPEHDPMQRLDRPGLANISCYAQGRDYHTVVKKRLKRVARWLHGETGAAIKVFVDTAPVMEKPLAEAAGLGWQGKHTNLVSRDFGSWLFLGAIYTSLPLPPDPPSRDHCGSCRACLDICPTNAFPAPRQLDARRCISYLTIEHAGHIDTQFRAPMGNRVYGCDDCLAVCPWNKWAQRGAEAALQPRAGLDSPMLAEFLTLNDAQFRARFAGSPVKRTGRDRFVRNCLIAAGNSGMAALMTQVAPLLDDPSPLVRAMAVWATGRLASTGEIGQLLQAHLPLETDDYVRSEWLAVRTRT